jgi:hypothetical protein
MTASICLAALLVPLGMHAQEIIKIKNASFEDFEDRENFDYIADWHDLGFDGETPPDVEPGNLELSTRAKHGRSYLILVTRDNNTWESLYQELESPLLKDSSYKMSVWLAHTSFRSKSRLSNACTCYDAPAVFKCFGYNATTQKTEILAQSPVIDHHKWKKYEFVLTPKYENYDFIVISAVYAPEYEQQNGTLLVDHLSDIVKARAMQKTVSVK